MVRFIFQNKGIVNLDQNRILDTWQINVDKCRFYIQVLRKLTCASFINIVYVEKNGRKVVKQVKE